MNTGEPSPAPSLTLYKVVVGNCLFAAIVVPLRLLLSDKPSPPGPLAATAVVCVAGSTAMWWAYHKASGRRDGLFVGWPLLFVIQNGVLSPLGTACTACVLLPLAYFFGSLLSREKS